VRRVQDAARRFRDGRGGHGEEQHREQQLRAGKVSTSLFHDPIVVHTMCQLPLLKPNFGKRRKSRSSRLLKWVPIAK
jgi:hypothetical protein